MRDVPDEAFGHEGEERLAHGVPRYADDLSDRRFAERRARRDLTTEDPITKRLGQRVDRAAAADLDVRQEGLVLHSGTVSAEEVRCHLEKSPFRGIRSAPTHRS